jgi:hypothetical protein
MPDITAQHILDLLAQERQAIIRSEFELVDRLATEKNEVFKQIDISTLQSHDLQQINIAMSQNQILIKAAIAGITAARARIAALEDVRSGLRTYNQEGNLAHVPSIRNDLNKTS